MDKVSKLMYAIIFVIAMTACDDKAKEDNSLMFLMMSAGRSTAEVTFDTADRPGDFVNVAAGLETFRMIYANDRPGITFPTGTNDLGTATLDRRFFMADTEVTNALFAEVLQWARDTGKIVEVSGAHNEVSAATVKYGNQELIDLDYDTYYMKITYAAASNRFSVTSGYDNHPVVAVSWYGAIMFCTWLTQMMDGSTANLVYAWIDNGDDGGTASDGIWQHGETYENANKTGFRLPSSEEWEFAARYIGTIRPARGDLASECVYYNKDGAFLALTPGYYWTPGDYASGALKDINNATETGAVAWYDLNSGYEIKVAGTAGAGGTTPKTGNANALDLYDMSGNLKEWCFSIYGGGGRSYWGGAWGFWISELSVSYNDEALPNSLGDCVGMRFARTR